MMAQLPYRANLSAKSWPFISTYFGRSVIVGSASHDQNFNRQLYSSADPDKDVGIPQMYYLHNVMPTSQGIQSIGYQLKVPPVTGVSSGFTNIFSLHYAEGSAYFACLPDGRCYTCQYGNSPMWVQINTIPGIAGRAVSVVNISGNSYVYFSGLGCYKYFPGVNALVGQFLSGLDTSKVLGIVGAVGYMIAYSSDALAWSSTVDATDFTPDLRTGAGGGGVELAKGPITLCVSHSQGLVVCTAYNAVNGVYSGNSRFPFNFREIATGGGLTSRDVIAQDISDGTFYAYSTVGLQQFSGASSTLLFPEVTDFLSGKVFEDFDESTNIFNTTVISDAMKKAVNIIANRYLVLSYGISELTHALVYDTVSLRWGKLKVTHTECFEYLLNPAELGEVSRQSIGFFKKDGSISTVNFDSTDTAVPHSGVVLLGKYQYVRARLLTLEEVTIENINTPELFTLENLSSLRGKYIDKSSDGYLQYHDGESCIYKFHDTGMNHTLVAKGSFYLVSLLLKFQLHGAR